MKRAIYLTVATALALANALPTAAQDEMDNPLDLTGLSEERKDIDVLTVAEVDDLEALTRAAFDAGDCKSALPLLNDYQKQANSAANLLHAGLKPFYGASYDDRKNFRGTGALVKYESASNQYKKKRNAAMVMAAECLVKTGDKAGAVIRFQRALELIDIDDQALWDRARKGLYSLIAFN
jgi:hypothetical protein